MLQYITVCHTISTNDWTPLLLCIPLISGAHRDKTAVLLQ